MLFLCSCSGIGKNLNQQENTKAAFKTKFNKICLDGTGKGRIELVGNKYTFSYESLINQQKNLFELALDFPIIGETKVNLSLSPKEAAKQINHSELISILKDKIGERTDRELILKTIQEFFIFSSDFISYKASGIFPVQFDTSFQNNHFLIERSTPHYHFQVDSFSENDKFFERVVFKIFLTSSSSTALSTEPIMTLFLVPQTCDRY